MVKKWDTTFFVGYIDMYEIARKLSDVGHLKKKKHISVRNLNYKKISRH